MSLRAEGGPLFSDLIESNDVTRAQFSWAIHRIRPFVERLPNSFRVGQLKPFHWLRPESYRDIF